MKPALDILLAGTSAESSQLEDLAAGLRRAGHTATVTSGTDAALGSATPDVLIATEAQGTSIFAAFNLPTGSPRFVFMAAAPNFNTAAAASRDGANEICFQPSIDELVEAVERGQVTTPANVRTFERHYSSDQTHRATQDILAFTCAMGIERSLRLRIVTATSELLTNANTHAYAGQPGPMTVKAGLACDPYGIDRLVVEVEDFGVGSKNTSAPEAALPHGFDFVRSLCERFDIETTNESFGARAEFALNATHFDEDPAGLDSLDFFEPECLREIFNTLNDPTEGKDALRFAPAAAATAGRILAAGRPTAIASLVTPR